MKNIKMELIKNNEFYKIYEIMEEAFPIEEFREYERQKALLDKDDYFLYVCKNSRNEILGFISFWKLDGFYYGEHLAVTEKGRNGGIGSFIFNWCLEHRKGKHVLEVEVPDEEIKKRRINFYKRLGFYYNEYEYIQPPMRKTTEPIPLMIMSYPTALSEQEFEHCRDQIYKVAYGYKGVPELIDKKRA